MEGWQHCSFNLVIRTYESMKVVNGWTSFSTTGTWKNGAAYILYIWSLNLARTYFEIYIPVIVYMLYWPTPYGQRAKTMQEYTISYVQISSTAVFWRFRTNLILDVFYIRALNYYIHLCREPTGAHWLKVLAMCICWYGM